MSKTPARSSAALHLRAGEGGSPVVEDLRSSGFLAFRPTMWGIWMVGTAAHPIGGDRLWLRVTVGSGCHARIRSASATVARRGPDNEAAPSSLAAAIRVGPGASLEWSPEPGVAAVGADHRNDTRVRMAVDSRLLWREEWTLGRHDEEPGTWRSRMRITMAGRPVLSSDLATGPRATGWECRSVLAGATAVCTLTIIDGTQPDAGTHPVRRLSAGTATGLSLPLVPYGTHITVWGCLLSDCRSALNQLLARSGIDLA
jgi:urease accessory protein